MNLLLDVNAIRQDAERAASLKLIRDALAQPRIISPATNGTLRPLPLRRPDPHQKPGSALLAALARR